MPVFQPAPDRHIACFDGVTADHFAEIMRQGQPVVLKGIAHRKQHLLARLAEKWRK